MELFLLVRISIVAALTVMGVSSDGHDYTCQSRIQQCTQTYDQTPRSQVSLTDYLACLAPIDCSASAEDAEAHEKMIQAITWSLNNYNELDYDKPSGTSRLQSCSLLVAFWVAAWAVGKKALTASF